MIDRCNPLQMQSCLFLSKWCSFTTDADLSVFCGTNVQCSHWPQSVRVFCPVLLWKYLSFWHVWIVFFSQLCCNTPSLDLLDCGKMTTKHIVHSSGMEACKKGCAQLKSCTHSFPGHEGAPNQQVDAIHKQGDENPKKRVEGGRKACQTNELYMLMGTLQLMDGAFCGRMPWPKMVYGAMVTSQHTQSTHYVRGG